METHRLMSLPLFDALAFEQLSVLAPLASEMRVAAGRRLLLGGPFAHELVVIEAGRAQVRCAGEPLGELGPGDLFGELARWRPTYATATVVALTELTLVTLSSRDLRCLGVVAPAVADALLDACRAVRAAGEEAAPARRAPRLRLARAA